MAALSGMKEICSFVKRSEVTVLDWIRQMDFPARKLSGVWESDIDLIELWRQGQITGESWRPGEDEEREDVGRSQQKSGRRGRW